METCFEGLECDSSGDGAAFFDKVMAGFDKIHELCEHDHVGT